MLLAMPSTLELERALRFGEVVVVLVAVAVYVYLKARYIH